MMKVDKYDDDSNISVSESLPEFSTSIGEGSNVTLTFESRSFKNNVVYGPDGRRLYEIESSKSGKLGKNVISLYRLSSNGKDQSPPTLVAEIDLGWMTRGDIRMQDGTHKITDVFQSKGVLSSSRLFNTPIGTLQLKISEGRPNIYDSRGHAVATYHVDWHLRSKNVRTYRVSHEAFTSLETLDLIMMACIFGIRDIEDGNNGTINNM